MTKFIRVLSFIFIIFSVSFVQLSWAQSGSNNAVEKSSQKLANQDEDLVLKDFKIEPFIICQKLVSARCKNSQTYQAAQSCISSFPQEPRCQAFFKFAKQVGFNPQDSIDRYKYYEPIGVTVFHLHRHFANYSGDYFIVDKTGNLTNTTRIEGKVDLKSAANYDQLIQRFPKADIWGLVDHQPSLRQLSNGNYALVFNYQMLNGCHACARAGVANVGYVYTSSGHFVGIQLLSIEVAQPVK